ncbi:MAG: LCP family protein [Anaerolineae bacterium]|jgi:LCP family protein required for cell wall assembly|nr:LCP family protein [Anaerolineae bacterium]
MSSQNHIAEHGPSPYPATTPLRRRIFRWRRNKRLLGCMIIILAPLACFVIFMLVYLIFPPEPMDIVILGVDARAGQGYLTRTDSVMLLNIDPGSMQVGLLSIPRDVFIEVPDYGSQRINTINVLGEQEGEGRGPALVKASFKESFDVDVERYVRLDFAGFVDLVDAVGGLDIDVPKLIIDYTYPTPKGGTMTVQFDPGKQHMDGETALQYARTRHQDGDYARAERQQQVFDALVKKLSDPRQIINWPRVLRAVQSSTDTDINTWDMIRMGPGLLLGWSSREHLVMDPDYLIGMKAGYWIPNYDKVMPWIEENFD